MKFRLEFKPEDCWIGVFWKVGGPVRSYVSGTTEYRVHRRIDLWVCLLPMLPIHLWWFSPTTEGVPCSS